LGSWLGSRLGSRLGGSPLSSLGGWLGGWLLRLRTMLYAVRNTPDSGVNPVLHELHAETKGWVKRNAFSVQRRLRAGSILCPRNFPELPLGFFKIFGAHNSYQLPNIKP
jgi:hypothetical protein